MELNLDLHVHSRASYDGRMGVEEIAAAAKARGLDAVAVCDHDVVYTGPTQVDGIWLIPGAEFSTEHGHLLGLFLETPMVHTTWAETTGAIRRQGGLTVLAHPFQRPRPAEVLEPLVPTLDGVEVWNGRANRKNPQANAQAAAFARQHGLVPTAGSDAHLAQEIGNGILRLTVEEACLESIRGAILAGRGAIAGREGPALCVARSQWTKLRKTHAPLPRYGKWAAFALKCAWQDGKKSSRKGDRAACP